MLAIRVSPFFTRTALRIARPNPRFSSYPSGRYGSDYESGKGANTSSWAFKSAPEVTKLATRFSSTRTPKEVQNWRAEHGITVSGTNCPDPYFTFEETPFPPAVKALLESNYSGPLAIQSQGWSVVMTGHNMVGCADTGSGKTVAFLLPLFEHIKLQPPIVRGQGPYALVMAPTRELAQQIEAEANRFARFYGVQVACLFGGQGNRGWQLRQLDRNPALVIATPGRLLDMVNVGSTRLDSVSFLVLDEADRMLDMGFGESLREIIPLLNRERQVCMWTATWPKNVDYLARDYIPEYVKVNVGSQELTANPNVKQVIEIISPVARLDRLTEIIKENEDAKILIFSGTKVGCEELGRGMWKRGFTDIATLHGDKNQQQRNAILDDFKTKTLKHVIATDVAARGLDVKDVDFVVNYDFPGAIDTYIHRIGRTARAGKKGTAISFLTPESYHMVHDLVDVLHAAGQPVSKEIQELKERQGETRRGGGGGRGRGGNSTSRYGDNFGSAARGGGGGKGRPTSGLFGWDTESKDDSDFESLFGPSKTNSNSRSSLW